MTKKAFEIIKNVTESTAETLLNVRSGGVVGNLRQEIRQLQAKNEALEKRILLLRANRNELFDENKWLEKLIREIVEEGTDDRYVEDILGKP